MRFRQHQKLRILPNKFFEWKTFFRMGYFSLNQMLFFNEDRLTSNRKVCGILFSKYFLESFSDRSNDISLTAKKSKVYFRTRRTWYVVMVHGAVHGAWCMVHGTWYMVHGRGRHMPARRGCARLCPGSLPRTPCRRCRWSSAARRWRR